MTSAATLRRQIEAALETRIPSALSPVPKIRSAVHSTGIKSLDDLLQGGLPQGSLTELVGPECSGRTSIALSFLAQLTRQARVCAWVDVSNALDPESAAAIGVDLRNLLWLRCGASSKTPKPAPYKFTLPQKYLEPSAVKKGLHGGGFGPHPRQEIQGLSNAVGDLLQRESVAPKCAEQKNNRPYKQKIPANQPARTDSSSCSRAGSTPWPRIEQALLSTDLLLQTGGFGAIVLDMASLAPEVVSRIPLATWYRYRSAAERAQSSILLLTQHGCAKSSAELVLRLDPAEPICDEPTVFTGIQLRCAIVRQKYTPEPSNVVLMRKPPQRANATTWTSRTFWADIR